MEALPQTPLKSTQTPPPTPVIQTSRPWLLIGLAAWSTVMAVGLAGAGGYWLGQRSQDAQQAAQYSSQTGSPSDQTTDASSDPLNVLPELAHEDALYAQMPRRSDRTLMVRNLEFTMPATWHYLQCQGTDLVLFLDDELAMDTNQECNFEPGGDIQILMTDNYGLQPGEQAALHQQPQVKVSGFTGYKDQVEIFRGTEATLETADRVVVELPEGYGHAFLVVTKLPGASSQAAVVFEDLLATLKLQPSSP